MGVKHVLVLMVRQIEICSWNKNVLDFGKSAGFRTGSVSLFYQKDNQQAANDKPVQVPLQWENVGIKLGDQTQQLCIVLHYNTECN